MLWPRCLFRKLHWEETNQKIDSCGKSFQLMPTMHKLMMNHIFICYVTTRNAHTQLIIIIIIIISNIFSASPNWIVSSSRVQLDFVNHPLTPGRCEVLTLNLVPMHRPDRFCSDWFARCTHDDSKLHTLTLPACTSALFECIKAKRCNCGSMASGLVWNHAKNCSRLYSMGTVKTIFTNWKEGN